MKLLLPFSFALIAGFTSPSATHAQQIVLSTDSANKIIMDSTNGLGLAEMQLISVSNPASYPGGKATWREFILKNIHRNVPISHKAPPGVYKVLISFTVRADGKLIDIRALSNCGYGLEAEVMRCIRLGTDWIPASTANGTRVRQTLKTLVEFNITASDVQVIIR